MLTAALIGALIGATALTIGCTISLIISHAKRRDARKYVERRLAECNRIAGAPRFIITKGE